MMTSPLVSILIPCHNGGAFLQATLESALTQTYPRIEIVLVDDGSTDDSLAIARSYEPRVSVLTGPRMGVSAARNHATQLASGDWLQYLDADDLLLPHAISSRLAAVNAEAGDVACGDWQRLSPRSGGSWIPGRLEYADYRLYAKETDLAVFKGFWAPPAALLYRCTLVKRIGGWHPGLPVIQDARFLFDAALHGGRFVHVAGESAQYRQHSGQSLSTHSRALFWKDIFTNTREIEAIWMERGVLSGARRSAVAESYILGAHVTFSFDRELYRANLAELGRFPGQRWSRFLRAATRLERFLGYAMSRRLLSLVRPPLPEESSLLASRY